MSALAAQQPVSSQVRSIEQQFGSLAIGSVPQSVQRDVTQNPPVPATMHPRVLAFFQEQARIAQQPAPAPLEKKYPDEIYRLADKGCLSSVDSPDWRLREISVKSTEAIMDLFNQEFRIPMTAASRTLLPRMNMQNLKETIRGNILVNISASNVPPSTERARFAIDRLGGLHLAVPQATVLGIMDHCARDFEHPLSEEVGAAFGRDLDHRTFAISHELYLPELRAMETLSQDPRVPVITIHGIGPLPLVDGIESRVAHEAGRRLILSGALNPHRTDALLEGYFKTYVSHCALDKHMKEHIAAERSFEDIGLSW